MLGPLRINIDAVVDAAAAAGHGGVVCGSKVVFGVCIGRRSGGRWYGGKRVIYSS